MIKNIIAQITKQLLPSVETAKVKTEKNLFRHKTEHKASIILV